MNRVRGCRLLACLSFCLLAAAAAAQPSETPTVWAQNMPRGAAAADSHFQRMIHFNAQYYSIFWHTLAPESVTEPADRLRWSPHLRDWREPEFEEDFSSQSVGTRLALEALRRGSVRSGFANDTDPNLALYLTRIGMPDDRARQTGSSTLGGPSPHLPVQGGVKPPITEWPNLYWNTADNITVTRSRFAAQPEHCQQAVFRTVWMRAGIDEVRAWMEGLAEFYNAYGNQNEALGGAGEAAFPARVIFDQEPALILLGTPVSNFGCYDGEVLRPMDAHEETIAWEDVLDYWAAVKANAKSGWDAQSTSIQPVPGCNGQSLFTLWSNRDRSQFTTPTVDGDDEPIALGASTEYIGGSARNQAWFRWFCQINQQAYIGALDEAAFCVVRKWWPDAICSDYDVGRTSAFGLRNYPGTYGPKGLNFPVEPWYGWWDNHDSEWPNPIAMTQDPAAARVQNAPHLYSDVTAWQWDKWRRSQPANSAGEPWGNTGDELSPTFGPRAPNGVAAPYSDRDPGTAEPGDDSTYNYSSVPFSAGFGLDDEFWEETSNRFNRWFLDGFVAKNPGAFTTPDSKAMAAWITLPHQPISGFGPYRGGVTATDTTYYKYNGLLYAYDAASPPKDRNYVPMRQSVYSTYRTLAAARARGVSDFFVWSDTGPDADPGWEAATAADTTTTGVRARGWWGGYEGYYMNRGPHPDWPANWTILRNAVNHVFNYSCSGVETVFGATLAHPSAGQPCVSAVRFADEPPSGAATASRSVRVNTATQASTKRGGVILTFMPGTDTGLVAMGTSINLSVRARPVFNRLPDPPEVAPTTMNIEVAYFVHDGSDSNPNDQVEDGLGGTWRVLGTADNANDPAVTVDTDGLAYGAGMIAVSEGTYAELRSRVPFSRIDGTGEGATPGIIGPDGRVKVRVSLFFPTGTAPSVEPALLVDHAAVYLSDEAYRNPPDHATAPNQRTHKFLIPGDLNTDGTVDGKDDLLFRHLVTPMSPTSNPPMYGFTTGVPLYRMFADFNRDGHLDYVATGANGYLGDRHNWDGTPTSVYHFGTTIVADYPVSNLRDARFNDAYRQAATERVHPCPGCLADMGTQGGSPGNDCILDNNDFVVFISYFFDENKIADVGSIGGLPGPDGVYDNNDFVVFISYFFSSIDCSH